MKVLPNYRIVLLFLIFSFALRAGPSYVDLKGNLIVDGEPFFVMGCFASAWQYNERIRLIDDLVAGGFNCVYSSGGGLKNFSLFDQYHDYAYQKGIKIISRAAVDNEWHSYYINKMKAVWDNEAILGWYIADDANWFTIADLNRLHNQAREIDSIHVTTISFYSSPWYDWDSWRMGQYAKTCDVIQMQSYPVGTEPIDEVYKDMRRTIRSADYYHKPVVIDLQVFNWQITGHDWGRWPTPEEIDLMSYLAIAAGVKGIMYYSYADHMADPNSTMPVTQPERWQAMCRAAREIRYLDQVYLHGQHHTEHPAKHLYQATWQYNNSLYLMVINTSESDTHEVAIDLPRYDWGSLHKVFTYRPGGCSLYRTHVSGTIGPQEVQIYKTTIPTAVDPERQNTAASSFTLYHCYPNPFNATTQIEYVITQPGWVKLEIYDLLGGEVCQIVDAWQSANQYRYTWNATDANGRSVPGGIYLVRLQFRSAAETATQFRKIMLLR